MPEYVRVRDKGTGHEFDAVATDKRIGLEFVPVDKPNFPPTWQPRRPRFNVGPSKRAVSNPRSSETADTKKEG